MDDFSHLIKRKNESDEGKGLLSSDTKPEEAKALLDKMKEISELIKDVSIPYHRLLNRRYLPHSYSNNHTFL